MFDVKADPHNIKEVFSGKTYYIDFYQRQYKWNTEPVKKLLDDIFYRFNHEYSIHKDDARDISVSINDYGWYYLNTIVTNSPDGKTCVADGQQRLTTILLVLMKLHSIAHEIGSKKEKTLDRLIADYDENDEYMFKVNHDADTETMTDVYENGEKAQAKRESDTSKNLVSNYKEISKYIDRELKGDKKIAEAFISYFINRIALIEISIKQDDVPMVFELINDRGVRLKPYEIIKGKLLGQIEKQELDQLELSEKWDEAMTLLGQLDRYLSDEKDGFFVNYLRAKFANDSNEGKKIDTSSYHRYIMDVKELHLEHNKTGVLDFLKKDFAYYHKLYWKIRRVKFEDEHTTPYKYLYYLSLNDQDRVLLLIMSACKINDADEEEKINAVSYEYDRLYSLLQLQHSYNSSDMVNNVYTISQRIRNGEVSDIHAAFNDCLLEALRKSSGNKELSTTWNYSLFRNAGYDNIDKRFLKYALGRVEQYICGNTETEMPQTLKHIITGGKNAPFHLEHILSFNDENRAKFKDEDTFISERNRLGDILLLKGGDNQSVNNAAYDEKLEAYANTFYWNETLREDTYKHKPAFTRWIATSGLNIRALNTFGADEIEERQRLLFDIFNNIWNGNN